MDQAQATQDSASLEDASQTPDSPKEAPDWLALANQAMNGSTSYLDTNYRAVWERSLRQFRSQHPAGSKYLSETWQHKSRFFRPKTRTAIRKNEAGAAAAFFSTQDVVNIGAQDDSVDLQRASADFWKECLNYRLTKTVPWFLILMGAYQDAQVMGAVVSHQCWNHDTDTPEVDLRPLENIRIDPAANWLKPMESSPYIIDMIPMYAFEVRERAKRTDGSQFHAVTEGQLKSATRNTYDSTRLAREGQRTDSKETGTTGISDFDIVWVHRVIMRRDGEDVLYYTLGQEALLTDPIALREAYPWLKKRERPYTMGICIIEAHRNMPSGIAELSASVQSEVNTLANNRMDNVRLVLDKRYLVKRHKQVDIRSLTRNIAGSVTMLEDPETDVKPLEWKDVTASSYQEQDRLNLDFDDLTGSFSGSSVQSNRKLNETVGGMNLLSSEANEVGDYTLKTFTETWLEPTLSQFLRMEQVNETDAVILALAGAKAQLIKEYGITMIDEQLLTQELELSLNIGMGSTNPLNNIERFMVGIQKLEEVFGAETVAQRLNFDEVSSELFGKLGYKDGKRFMLDAEDPRVAALNQKIAELQQKVDRKRAPEVDSADAMQKRALAVKTLVEAVLEATQAAQAIATVPETAPVADAVLELSGYQRPSPAGVDPNLPQPAQLAAPAMPALPAPVTGQPAPAMAQNAL